VRQKGTRAGRFMRRARAFVVFGWSVSLLAVATVSVRSNAAGKQGDTPAPAAQHPHAHQGRLELLPAVANLGTRESPAFGSFLRPGSSPEALPSDAACSPDMVEVEGDYCPYVEQKCLRWLDPETKLQCAEFDHPSRSASCSMRTQHKKYCVDRYEWPNKQGVVPRYMVSWNDAKATCESSGKRLCSDTEWTLACEGPQRQPYPYGNGYVRDDAACNIDKPYIWPHPEKVYDRNTSADELARLDQREPSGARAACVSPYGVHDMAGNVDEWVLNESQSGRPFKSALKGATGARCGRAAAR
jgi:formylglycine-generating enzyme